MLNWMKNVAHHGSEWRFALRLWNGLGFNGRSVIIIPSELDNLEDPATGAGECRSSSLVSVCCGVLGARNLSIVYPHELFGEPLQLPQKTKEERIQILKDELGAADVILLGSSLKNSVTEFVMEMLIQREPELKMGCRQTDDGNHVLSFDGHDYATEYVSGEPRTPENMLVDYGYFLVRPNIFCDSLHDKGRIFIFSGAHTYGTQAVAEMLFSPQGAAKIGRKFRKARGPKQDEWRRSICGLIKISPVVALKVKGNRRPGLAMSLTHRDRVIEIIAPDSFKGIEVKNPVMSPALERFYYYVNWGKWRDFGLNSLSILTIFVATTGLYFHHWLMCLAGAAFYIVVRFIHREGE